MEYWNELDSFAKSPGSLLWGDIGVSNGVVQNKPASPGRNLGWGLRLPGFYAGREGDQTPLGRKMSALQLI